MKHVHLIGIGGAGLSAIARLLMEVGYTVSGSDRELTTLAQQLMSVGARVSIGHRPENINAADVVVRSSAVPDENVEIRAAKAAGIPVLRRSEFLGQIMEGHQVIAVAGTHGKTTTTAMIAWLLTALGHDPSYILGGVSENLGTNAHAGIGRNFVIEADEYDHMFLGLRPNIAVVTNVEHDHPDCFPTPQDFRQAFVDFVHRLTPDGVLVVCGDDAGSRNLVEDDPYRQYRTLTYGLGSSIGDRLAYEAKDLNLGKYGGFSYKVYHNDEYLAKVLLQVPGEHNVQNSLAALAVAHVLNMPIKDAAVALGDFLGTRRRFEVRGETSGVIVIDDYAHHPTEIRATILAARARYPEHQLWVVWQPHTYSRTRIFFNQFTGAFKEADHVLVTEVYPAREPVPADFSAQQVVKEMHHPDAHFTPDFMSTTELLLTRLRPGSVLLVLSAGDANVISTKVLAALPESEEGYV